MEDIELKLKEIFDAITQREPILNKEIRNCDLGEQDVLHDLELSKFNACEGYFYAKKLKEIREERRIYKNERTRISNLKNKLKDVIAIINKPEINKIYKPRIRQDLKIQKQELKSDVNKLQKVNKTNIKFAYSEKEERLNKLFEEIRKEKL